MKIPISTLQKDGHDVSMAATRSGETSAADLLQSRTMAPAGWWRTARRDAQEDHRMPYTDLPPEEDRKSVV